jgi:hypothetical protein
MTQTYTWNHGLEVFVAKEVIKQAVEAHPALVNQIEILDINDFMRELARELIRETDSDAGSIFGDALDKAAINIIESGHDSVRFKL